MVGRLNKTVGDEKPAKHDGNEGLVDHRFSFADCEESIKAYSDTISLRPMTETSGCQTDSSPHVTVEVLNNIVEYEKSAKNDENEDLVDHRFSFADCGESEEAYADGKSLSPKTETCGCYAFSTSH
uniref:Uncharacterized protein n=1 Tax=Caenorhabditis japonica TaxID=281687 RepID=A0A8R1EBN6_CAEJA